MHLFGRPRIGNSGLPCSAPKPNLRRRSGDFLSDGLRCLEGAQAGSTARYGGMQVGGGSPIARTEGTTCAGNECGQVKAR